MARELIEAARAIRARTTPGSSVEDGRLYHDLPFEGLPALPAHRRGTRARVAQLLELADFRGKRVLDLGCGPGGISIGLALAGAREVVGLDVDPQAIRVARAAAAELGLGAVKFDVADVADLLLRRSPGDHDGAFDVVVWLSEFMWLRREHGLEAGLEAIHAASRLAPVMLFETAAADGEAGVSGEDQGTVHAWLRRAAVQSRAASRPSPAGWHRRRVFRLSHPRLEWHGDTADVTRLDAWTVSKVYRPEFAWMAEREAEALERVDAFTIAPRLMEFSPPELVLEFAGWQADVTPALIEQSRDDVVDALDAAAVRHRDIRPSNLLALRGVLRVIDFGWCLLDDEERTCLPDPPQLNDREDGRGKWGGPDLDDDTALREIARHLGRTNE